MSEPNQVVEASAPIETTLIEEESNQPAPVSTTDRITALDTVRGFALLGILLMNVLTFSYFFSASFNPTVQGGATGVNLWTYITMAVLFDGKMRALFSMMFGAGVILMTSRAVPDIADVHYRRMMWMALFGAAHAYLIWWGDILYPYALCGLILFPMRKLSAKALIITGVVMVLLTGGMGVGQGFDTRSKRQKALEADAAEKQGTKLTEEQKEAQKKWKDVQKFWQPDAESLKKDSDAYRGSYLAALKHRAGMVLEWHSSPYYGPGLWDMFSMMFIGMGLMKLKFFAAEWPAKTYVRIATAGYLLGIPIMATAVGFVIKSNYDVVTASFGLAAYHPSRLLIAMAHASVLLLIVKTGALSGITSRLAAVGQMAFSNYIFHSVVCSIVFYGYGFKLYGQLQRHQLYYVVGAIWLFQLLVSPIWLRHFRFGPLEWVWRSLTYWKRQPMRIHAEEASIAQVAVA